MVGCQEKTADQSCGVCAAERWLCPVSYTPLDVYKRQLQRGAPKPGKDGKPMKDKHGKVIYEPYRIKVLNTINFKKSMHYNPFSYIHSEKDILKLVTTLIANTKGNQGSEAGISVPSNTA